ncbi:MAG: c-type cytochrome [Opitutales bacterium]
MSDEHSNNPVPEDSRESLEKAAMQDEHMQDVHAQLMREKEEPQEGFNPVPIFLLFVFAALCFWGGVYIVHYGGDFRADVYDPHFDPASTAPPRPEISLFDRGAKVYRNQCAQCHQADGNGVPGVYPPLPASDWVTGHAEVVSRILINGLNGPIVVKGSTYNGNMPAFGPGGLNLKPKDIAGVITYIRQEWGNTASEVSEETILAYLDTYSGRSTPWQAAELLEGLGPEPIVAAEEAMEAIQDELAH